MYLYNYILNKIFLMMGTELLECLIPLHGVKIHYLERKNTILGIDP